MNEFSPLTVMVIICMGIVTYATKAGGLWILDRVTVPERSREGLEALPSGIIIAILAPQLIEGSPYEWAAALVVILVASRTDSLLLALCVGVGTLLFLRGTSLL